MSTITETYLSLDEVLGRRHLAILVSRMHASRFCVPLPGSRHLGTSASRRISVDAYSASPITLSTPSPQVLALLELNVSLDTDALPRQGSTTSVG